MSEVLFPYQKVGPLTRFAEAKRKAVYDARAALREAERELERKKNHIKRTKAILLEKAFGEGEIDGRNAQERDIQIDALEANTELNHLDHLWSYQDKVEAAQRELDLAVCELETVEDEISLTRAWLYSQTRIR